MLPSKDDDDYKGGLRCYDQTQCKVREDYEGGGKERKGKEQREKGIQKGKEYGKRDYEKKNNIIILFGRKE